MAATIDETLTKLMSDHANTSQRHKELIDLMAASNKLEKSIEVIFHLIVARQGMAASIAAYDLMAIMYMIGYDAAEQQSLANLFEE